MIITTYGIIVFQLSERIPITAKSGKPELRYCFGLQGFAYKAIPTRHDVCTKPYLHCGYGEIKKRQ